LEIIEKMKANSWINIESDDEYDEIETDGEDYDCGGFSTFE
jgi:hypothetical protein